MTDETGYGVLTDAQWEALAPLIAQCRPPHKTEHKNLRRTIEAIVWRHENGATWRSLPPPLGPWWMAAQTFICWSHHGVWERLLELAQQRKGLQLGMAFLDGSTIRAHQKAAGAAKKGDLQSSGTSVRRWAARAAASRPRPRSSSTAPAERSASPLPPDQPMSCRWRRVC
jgi:transposase